MNVKILVCCHKKDVMATQNPYLPIQVGKAISNVNLGIQGDDTGENISNKNASYCEMTGMYWAWKNLKNVDIIGLCHYRRYFDFHGQCDSVFPTTNFQTECFDKIDLSIPDRIFNRIDDQHVVVSRKFVFHHNIFDFYCGAQISNDMRVFLSVIDEMCGEKYKKASNDIIMKGNSMSPCDMFIMTWENFDKYCSWVFPLLAEVERRTDISHYNSNNKRLYGYLGEITLNIFIYANKIKPLRYPMIVFKDEKERRSKLKFILNTLRFNIANFFVHLR